MNDDLYKAIVAGLKGNTDAVLAFALMVVGAGLLATGVSPWIACGLPLAIYVLYQFRMFTHDKHLERMAELNVQKLEQSKGKAIRQRIDRAKERKGS